MVDIRELRIGNLVYYRNNEIHRITEIIDYHQYEYDPIPISQEWRNAFRLEEDELPIVQVEGQSIAILILGNRRLGRATSVHQLQNLLFAITEEDWKPKIPKNRTKQ